MAPSFETNLPPPGAEPVKAPPSRHKTAYIMSRFPHLPETFILREMIELERQGWEIALYPLIVQQQPVIHPEARPWLPRARAVPFLSTRVMAANSRFLRADPGLYFKLWQQVLKGNLANPRFLARGLALLPKSIATAEMMQQEGVEHIHAHYATFPALAAWIIHQITGISYSVTVHAHDIFVSQAMLAEKLRLAAFVVAISRYNRIFLQQNLGGWIAEKTLVIHCGIDPSGYAIQAKPEAEHCIFNLVNIGSLQPYKGQDVLIKACSLLRQRGVPFRCQIIGSGEKARELEKLIRAENLDKQVQPLGALPQEEVARRLSCADGYVQPSIITPSKKMEGIPVAIMEALACELVVIASDLSGIPEIIQDGVTGLLSPPGDAQQLADAIQRAIEHPSDSRRMAAAGRQLVLDEFCLSKNTARLGECFSQVIAGGRAF